MSQRFEQFGKYLLLEKLASGGMAEVFLARAQGAGGITKFVAIKRILPQFAESQEFIDMFKSEAKIAVNLSHSNIVSIYDFGVQKSQFYLVMDYVEGRNLRQILNKMKKAQGRFSTDQVIYIIKEIAAGLDHAHRCHDGTTGKPLNITHRDMSPQNVMVTFEGEIKIVDFGIAKAESQLETTRAGTLKGKFGYMSPEQAEGQVVDLRTDIFSLGIILWELLANDRLFNANNEMNTLRKIRDCQVPGLRKVNPNVPVELERIAMKALARDRNLRYQTAAALHRDLNRFLNRHFPEFSTQDFAAAIKHLFSEEIYSIRQRLVEYAKLPTNDEDVVQLTNTIAPRPNGQDISTPAPDNGPSFSQSVAASGMSNSSDFDFNPPSSHSDITLPPPSSPHSPNHETRVSSSAGARSLAQARSRDLVTEESQPSISNRTNTRTFYRAPSVEYSSPPLVRLVSGALMIALVLGAYVFSVKKFDALQPVVQATDPYLRPIHQIFGISGVAHPSSTSAEPPPEVATSPQVPEPVADQPQIEEPLAEAPPAELPDVMEGLLVTSQPSGAEVLLDGISTGRTTPAKIMVPANKPFQIALRRSGYIDYLQSDVMLSQVPGSKIAATLQQALLGYIDIDVKPPSPVKIFVNGKALTEKHLPIERYAIPAEANVVIRAEDPFKQTFTEQTVRVSQGTRSRVVLDMKQARPQPSGRLPSRIPNSNNRSGVLPGTQRSR